MATDLGGAHARLPAVPSSVGDARRLVRRALTDAGRADLVDNAELVVSEAVTNALVHAGTPIDVSVRFDEGRVRLEVGDGSAHAPMPRSYAATAGTGRGLMLIDGLTRSWGTNPHGGGKTVWFELDGGDRVSAADFLGEPSGPPTPREGTRVEVELVAFPTLLYVAWREYAESLLRDFLLAGLDGDDDDLAIQVHAESSQALALLAENIATPPLSDDPTQVVADAAAPTTTAQILLGLPVESVALFATLDATLDAAGQMSELETFLTAPIQPEMRQFRRWLCGQVGSQADGAPPAPWSPHPYAAEPLPRISRPVDWDLATLTASSRCLLAADDTDGIVAVSESAAALLGYDHPADLVGHRLVSIIPDRFRQAHIAGFTLHLLNGRSVLLDMPVQVPLRRRDGTETTADLRITAHRANDGRAVFVGELAPVADV